MMPYNIRKEGDEFCVYNSETGKKEADFPTRREAVAKMRALMQAEAGEPGKPAEGAESKNEKD